MKLIFIFFIAFFPIALPAADYEDITEAAAFGNADAVRKFLSSGANVNQTAQPSYMKGQTALMRAAGNGHIEVIKILIEAKADLNLKDAKGMTALDSAADMGKEEAAILLFNAGAKGNYKPPGPNENLLQTARGGSAKGLQDYLKAGADINARDKDGRTALMLATPFGDVDTVQAFLDAKADVNAKDNEGRTALMSAPSNVIKLLLGTNADVHAKDNQGRNALFCLVEITNETIQMRSSGKGGYGEDPRAEINEAASILIDAKIDVKSPDKGGMTILKLAAKNKHTAIVKLLRKAGAKK